MIVDPFSDILKLTNAQTVVSGGFTAGGLWAMRFPPPDKMKFFALVKGSCWLSIDGNEAPVRIEAGDMFLVSAQRSFVLAADLTLEPLDAVTVFAGKKSRIAQVGDGDDCVQIGCHVRLDPASRRLLADVLPPLIHVRASSPQAAVLQWLLDQLVLEQAEELPGANVASAQLAQLMFVQLLRAYLADSESLPLGWLKALSDPEIAPVLRLMHGDPGKAWGLEELARAAAMSRTTFAVRFKSVAGVPPLTYLLNWRMRLAEHALREEDTTISDLGMSLGYTSESAFSNAFKRVMGSAPKRYRDAVRKTVSARN
ncbi:MAG: AraC family transcriptional regulator [Capsulimonas sp.]|uniref:AraC family transcriptional regulator n=1 Tax=Capsulimonas sp. TaxID=2494211 RepID=UPI003264F514